MYFDSAIFFSIAALSIEEALPFSLDQEQNYPEYNILIYFILSLCIYMFSFVIYIYIYI